MMWYLNLENIKEEYKLWDWSDFFCKNISFENYHSLLDVIV
jgi:hypothetical protein